LGGIGGGKERLQVRDAGARGGGRVGVEDIEDGGGGGREGGREEEAEEAEGKEVLEGGREGFGGGAEYTEGCFEGSVV